MIKKTLSDIEISSFCMEVAMLLHAGMPLKEGLYIMEEEERTSSQKSLLKEVHESISKGMTFHDALAKCGVTTKHIESLVRVLSGGEQAKVRLCKLINRETNVLLLDEPTNHLDVDAKEELKRALKAYHGSILMVCHEPEFYEDIATQVWDCTKWSTLTV